MMKNLQDWAVRLTLFVAVFMVTGAPGKGAPNPDGGARVNMGGGGNAGGGAEAGGGFDLAAMFPYIVIVIAVVALSLAAILSRKKNAPHA